MKNDTSTIKYLTERESDELFEIIDKDKSRYQIRNRAIFYLSRYCALRVSEVCEMKYDAVNIDRREVYCKRLKGSRSNTLKIIDEKVYDALSKYMEYRKMVNYPSNYLFVSQQNEMISRKTLDSLMRKYCKQSDDIPSSKWHFHVLKHTRAIELAEGGLDIKEIQFWLGHRNVNNTEIYFQFTSRQQLALYNKLQSIS